MRNPIIKVLKFVCGTEGEFSRKLNRANLFTLISALLTIVLLLFTFFQLRDVKETNSADFALKLKTDILSADNVTLISLLDDSLVVFCPYGNNDGWFELDSPKIKAIPPGLVIKNATRYYTLVQIDQLLQDFENLSFYEKRGRIDMQYIYEQFAYYITALWKNGYIQQYITMTRRQHYLQNAYSNFEKLNDNMIKRFIEDSTAAAEKCNKK